MEITQTKERKRTQEIKSDFVKRITSTKNKDVLVIKPIFFSFFFIPSWTKEKMQLRFSFFIFELAEDGQKC